MIVKIYLSPNQTTALQNTAVKNFLRGRKVKVKLQAFRVDPLSYRVGRLGVESRHYHN